jgi:lysophospholipase L1-like esterase
MPLSQDALPAETRSTIPFKRRLIYACSIYLVFLFVLLAIEVGTRLTMSHVSSLDLFVVTKQQQAQVANEKQSGIFEGDPLLLWRLKPNLDHVVWDFTVLSTNSQHLRMDRELGPKQPGAFRIVCLGDSVTFGYRVPVVWPNNPSEYDREWLPYPMLLERELRAANPNRTIEVITMAVPGYTSHQGLAWLKNSIDDWQPDLLTVSFGWNDASLSDAPDRQVINTGWYSVGTRWLIDHSQAFAHAAHWLRSSSRLPTDQRRPVARVSKDEYLNNILAIVRLTQQRKAGIIVIAAPYRDAVTNPPEAKAMINYRAALRSVMDERHLPFLEIRELTEEAYPSNAGWFGELIHPNHMGHRLIASELLKAMSEAHLLKDLKVPGLTP